MHEMRDAKARYLGWSRRRLFIWSFVVQKVVKAAAAHCSPAGRLVRKGFFFFDDDETGGAKPLLYII